MILLITLQAKSARRKFQKLAAENGWTASDLRDAIHNYRKPDSARGGRPVKVPADRVAARRLLFQESERWLQRFKAVTAEHPDLFARDAAGNGKLLESLEIRLAEMNRLSRRSLKLLREGTGC